jgi:hypothetical protein
MRDSIIAACDVTGLVIDASRKIVCGVASTLSATAELLAQQRQAGKCGRGILHETELHRIGLVPAVE